MILTNAYREILDYLKPGEIVEAIVLGEDCRSRYDDDDDLDEEKAKQRVAEVPKSALPGVSPGIYDGRSVERLLQESCGYPRGKVMSFKDAKPFLLDWRISGSFGGEEVIYFYAWTNFRVLFIGCYDGSTWLTSIPRNPIDCEPYSTGGG